MSKLLDGNIFPIQFRAHDNNYANSPVSKLVGGGYLLSSLLSLGEAGFNQSNLVLSIGAGYSKGLSAVSTDLTGNNLRFDLTPVGGTGGCLVTKSILYNNSAMPVLKVKFDS